MINVRVRQAEEETMIKGYHLQRECFKTLRNGSDKLFNHLGTEHKDFVKRIIAMVPEGGNYKDLPEGVGTSRKFNEAWTRYQIHDGTKSL